MLPTIAADAKKKTNKEILLNFPVNIVNNLYWYIPFYTLYIFLMTLQIQFAHTSWGLGARYRRLNFALRSIFLKGMKEMFTKLFLEFFVEFSSSCYFYWNVQKYENKRNNMFLYPQKNHFSIKKMLVLQLAQLMSIAKTKSWQVSFGVVSYFF